MDYGSTGAMRSPFSPRLRQSITGRRPLGLSSAKKNQSKFSQSLGDQTGDVVYKTATTTIKTYGMPLPVMVTEALTFATGEVSVRLSPCGWCWVVSGRRVVTWARAPTPSGSASPAPATTIARELTLPQTDLAHKADLVVIYYEEGAQMPSCIGVSPEGTVRYWPSVGQEGVYVDVSCELAGQECEKLSDYTSEGLVLATTTCTVVILTPTVVDGRATVSCRTLRPPSGWLGGIGRRVSLLFFGSMPAHADTKLVGVAVVPGEEESTIALVAGAAGGAGGGAGPALQLWRGAELHEHEVRRALVEHLAAHGELGSLEMAALEVRAGGRGTLLLLLATVNVARCPDVRYAIATINVEEPREPRVTCVVSARGWAGGADEPPRFLPLPQRALIYTSKYLGIISMSGGSEAAEYMDVGGGGERLLCAEVCGGLPLLFSAKHGVLVLHTDHHYTPSGCDSPLGSTCSPDMYDGNLSLYEIDPNEVNVVTRDACGKLKTAFLFHVRRDAAACRALLAQLFPAHAEHAQHAERDVDAELDRTVLAIATEMLDDVPAGDPRWKAGGGPATNIRLGSSAALQVAAQLRDKRRAFTMFVEFLRAVGLWQRLGRVTKEAAGGAVSTQSALGALAEQLAIAIALRDLQHGSDAQLIDAAIYQVVCGSSAGVAGVEEVAEEEWVEEALSSGALSPADVCFRRAACAARVVRALARAAPPTHDVRAHAAHAAATINIITTVLRAVHKVRAQWQGAPLSQSVGPRGLLPALLELHKRALTECAHNCEDATLRAQVFEACASLADMILAEGELLNASARTHHVYERIRRETIEPFVEEGQTERAAALAEKFRDLELLVELCVRRQDYDQLFVYVHRYIDEGMAELTFARLAERGGAERAALVRAGAGAGAALGARLEAWLRAAPGRAPLLALYLATRAQLHRAAAVLADCAHTEQHSLDRMTTMASLGKLCLVASDAEDESDDLWQRLEARLTLADLQATLPRDLRLPHGLDQADTRVVPPEDLVQMYIESKSGTLTEYEYKKALELTEFVHDMERRDELRLRVWCACIAHDSWSSCRVDAPQHELRDKMFFKLIDLVHLMGGDLDILLPPMEDILTAPELAELVSDPRVHFLIKYGYECVDTIKNVMVEG